MINAFKVLGAFALIAVCAICTGFVVQDAWGWFIVPLGVKDITHGHATGLVLFLGLLRLTIPRDGAPYTLDEVITAAITWVVMTLALWGMMAFTAGFFTV